MTKETVRIPGIKITLPPDQLPGEAIGEIVRIILERLEKEKASK